MRTRIDNGYLLFFSYYKNVLYTFLVNELYIHLSMWMYDLQTKNYLLSDWYKTKFGGHLGFLGQGDLQTKN